MNQHAGVAPLYLRREQSTAPGGGQEEAGVQNKLEKDISFMGPFCKGTGVNHIVELASYC